MAGETAAAALGMCPKDAGCADPELDEAAVAVLDRPGALSVSIVVVSYNYAVYLAEAVESALAQTYPCTEVVVVDDGSTDASREILRAFGDRIRLVLKDNGGETSAVNAGFAASLGDIVMFLDSDDILDPAAAGAVVEAWRPGTEKVQFRLIMIDAEGQTQGWGFPRYPPGFSANDVDAMARTLGFYPTPPTTGNAYGRSFLGQILPLDTHLFPFAPDGALNVVAPLYGEVVTLDRTLGCYRVHDRNMWASPTLNPERILSWIALGRKEAAFLRAHAQTLGVRIGADDPLDHSWIYLQRRLAARKLTPDHPLVAGERPLTLFMLACRALRREEPDIVRRTVKIAWFLATAVSPERIARRFLEWVFVPSAKQSLLRRLRRMKISARR